MRNNIRILIPLLSLFLLLLAPAGVLAAENTSQPAAVPAEETVFIDDSVRNLEGAAALGITPILIAANPASDVETSFLKIHDLRELIRE